MLNTETIGEACMRLWTDEMWKELTDQPKEEILIDLDLMITKADDALTLEAPEFLDSLTDQEYSMMMFNKVKAALNARNQVGPILMKELMKIKPGPERQMQQHIAMNETADAGNRILTEVPEEWRNFSKTEQKQQD